MLVNLHINKIPTLQWPQRLGTNSTCSDKLVYDARCCFRRLLQCLSQLEPPPPPTHTHTPFLLVSYYFKQHCNTRAALITYPAAQITLSHPSDPGDPGAAVEQGSEL
jgi:hypothetical protein